MKIEIELPKEITVDDYHDFDLIEEKLKQIDHTISITEIGYRESSQNYVGIVHSGPPLSEFYILREKILKTIEK